MDRCDQLRSEFTVQRYNAIPRAIGYPTSSSYSIQRLSTPIYFRDTSTSAIHTCRKLEAARSHRLFREPLITALVGAPPLIFILRRRITQKSVFRKPYTKLVQANRHTTSGGNKNTRCYFCRWKSMKGGIRLAQIKFTRYFCALCSVALCHACFDMYHEL